MNKKILITTVVTFFMGLLLPAFVFAVPLTSPNYKLDPQGINAVGGQGSSTNYRMVSSGGEAVVGNGSGGSYKLSSGYVGALQQSIELSLTESGVQAYYPLNTNTGVQAYDATANNNNGVFAASTAQPSWTSNGKIDGAVSFDGGDSITVPDNASLRASTLTVSAWIRVTSTPSNSSAFIAKQAASNNRNYVLYITAAGTLNASASFGGVQSEVTSGTAINDGQFHHVVYTIGDGQHKLFVDGIQRAAVTHPSGTVDQPTNNLIISGTSGFAHILDEVKVINRTLSAVEIVNMYDANMAGVANAITVPQVIPGNPQTVSMDMTVITDAGGYDAAISQNNNLTHSDNTTTIAATAAGNIAAPGLWDDGTTKGLGFTLTGGLSLPTKWGTGPVNYKYAALPNSATTFFSRTGLSGGQKEVTNMQFKLDVPTGQKSGQYSNIATVTATLKP